MSPSKLKTVELSRKMALWLSSIMIDDRGARRTRAALERLKAEQWMLREQRESSSEWCQRATMSSEQQQRQ